MFYSILLHMTRQGDTYEGKDLITEFCAVCKDYNMSPGQGPAPRFRAQPGVRQDEIFTRDFADDLIALKSTIEDLECGRLLDNHGQMVRNGPTIPTGPEKQNVYLVGDVASISFASLCVFTGMATSEYAIQTAKQAVVNDKSRNNYWDKLVSFLEESNPTYTRTIDKDYVKKLWTAVGKSISCAFSTVENSICAIFRKSKKQDTFFKGQSLYTLMETSTVVHVKTYGSNEWETMRFN